MKRSGLALVALLTSGCGYVGEPLPPLLNIPERVTDLSAVQHGSRILVQFSVPRLTTEGMAIKKPVRIELRAGLGGDPFDPKMWAASAKELGGIHLEDNKASYEEPAAEWISKQVIFGVNIIGENGRASGWSNFAVLKVVPPLETPADVRTEAVSQGVRVTWTGTGSFRIFRRVADEQAFAMAESVDRPEWIDTHTQYGQTYHYRVQKIFDTRSGIAESEPSQEAVITPEDRFPPAIPAGLKSVAGTSTIELIWDRNVEADLAGYRVYRATPGGSFQQLTPMEPNPAFSDAKVESGKKYRYTISAVDQRGNESAKCAEVEAVAP